MCVECAEDSISLSGVTTCVPLCESHQYLARVSANSAEHECRVCHDQCLNCTGPENTDCLQCRQVNNTDSNGVTTCQENCPTDAYESDASRLCLPCHAQCIGCRGPSNVECLTCRENTVQLGGGAIECGPFCAFGMMYSSMADSCQLTL